MSSSVSLEEVHIGTPELAYFVRLCAYIKCCVASVVQRVLLVFDVCIQQMSLKLIAQSV
jgi:hypothetical protein